MSEIRNDHKEVSSKEQGQSIVEFVLLLLVLLLISIGFLKVINTNVADQWKEAVRTIVNDPSQDNRVDY